MKKIVLMLFFATILVVPYCQNVGIGTTSPIAKLDVSSSDNYTARFNGSDQMFVGLAENQVLKGYLGSFSGLSEDIDMGTSTGNIAGKLHLTIRANPKLTIDNLGNVGIGTTTPSEKLDVPGNIMLTGEVKPNGIAGAAGQVLTSNGNGSMQWAQAQSAGEVVGGAGTWGDCSMNNVEAFYPVANLDGSPNQQFGNSVSISGEFAIVGTKFESSGNGITSDGTATIYKRNPVNGAWEVQVKLTNTNAASYDYFGNSVAISNDFAVIGAPNDGEAGQTSNGSVSVYKRNATSGVWEFQVKLLNITILNGDNFGSAVAISGDYLFASADSDNIGGLNSGSVTIFKRNAATGIWEPQGKIFNPNAEGDDQFGNSLGVSGSYAIVGAPYDNENGLDNSGSATIFKRNVITGIWEPQIKLLNASPANNDRFGEEVSISGDYAIVGTQLDDEGGLTDNGSATIFKRNSTTETWIAQGSKFTNDNPSNLDLFGSSVYISSNFAIIGCYSDNVAGLNNNGSATIYARYGSVWRKVQKLWDPNGSNSGYFGTSISLDGLTRRFLVGSTGIQSSTGMVFFGKIK